MMWLRHTGFPMQITMYVHYLTFFKMKIGLNYSPERYNFFKNIKTVRNKSQEAQIRTKNEKCM
jgi:hypothetical protein